MRFFHSASSPLSSSRPSRYIIPPLPFSAGGKFASSHSRASVRKASRSAPPKSAIGFKSPRKLGSGLGRIGQAQNPLGNDVALNLLAAAEDGCGLAGEPAAHGGELVGGEIVALPAQALVAHDLQRQLGALLADLGAGVLHDRGGGAGG